MEIVRKVVPESVRERVGELVQAVRSPGDGAPGPGGLRRPEGGEAEAAVGSRDQAVRPVEKIEDLDAAFR